MTNDAFGRTPQGFLQKILDRIEGLETRFTKLIVGAHSGEGRIWFGGDTPPSGWLLCQGQSLLRADYPDLFTAIGTTYGAADSTHFNLPDLRHRVPAGRDAGNPTFDTLGETFGAETHTHPLSAAGHAVIGMGNPSGNPRIFMKDAADVTSLTADRYATPTSVTNPGSPGGTMSSRTALGGTSDAGSSLPPGIVVNYIIRI